MLSPKLGGGNRHSLKQPFYATHYVHLRASVCDGQAVRIARLTLRAWANRWPHTNPRPTYSAAASSVVTCPVLDWPLANQQHHPPQRA